MTTQFASTGGRSIDQQIAHGNLGLSAILAFPLLLMLIKRVVDRFFGP